MKRYPVKVVRYPVKRKIIYGKDYLLHCIATNEYLIFLKKINEKDVQINNLSSYEDKNLIAQLDIETARQILKDKSYFRKGNVINKDYVREVWQRGKR